MKKKYREQQVVNSHPSNVFFLIADMYCRLHIDPINLWLILEAIHLFNQPCLLWVSLIMFLMNRIIKTYTFPETRVSKIIGKYKIHEKVSKKVCGIAWQWQSNFIDTTLQCYCCILCSKINNSNVYSTGVTRQYRVYCWILRRTYVKPTFKLR